MKPQRIFIVRHAQSQGNIDKNIYKDIPDYALRLTSTGEEQARNAGISISSIIKSQSVQYYVSSFWRTRQTYLHLKKCLQPVMEKYYEDPRIREQEWGQEMVTRDGYSHEKENDRDLYGHFYYRFRDEESCADLYDRVSDFIGTMHRDFEKKDFPRNVILITHGMTMRLFLMRWFHVPVEEFEQWSNPLNGEYYLLEFRDHNKKYELITPLKKHIIKHSFQFPFGEDKKHFPFIHNLPYELGSR